MNTVLRKAAVPLFFGGPFGLFVASFAVADYNRELPAGKLEGFKGAKNPESLRQCLKKLNDQLSSHTLISSYGNKCEELYVVNKLVTERVVELKALDVYKGEGDYKVRADAISELEDFTRKMCHRAMIRNAFYMDWFFETVYDNAVKCYVVPLWLLVVAVSLCV
jgi:hypothetical protein